MKIRYYGGTEAGDVAARFGFVGRVSALRWKCLHAITMCQVAEMSLLFDRLDFD